MTGTNHQGSVEIDADEIWTHEEPVVTPLAKGQDWQIDMVTLAGRTWCEVTRFNGHRSEAFAEMGQAMPAGLTWDTIESDSHGVTDYYHVAQ